MIIQTDKYKLLLNPYPAKSPQADYWDKWAVRTPAERSAFLAQCEALPPAMFHGAASWEWDVVSRM